jgi:hypothetical protein
VLKYKKKTSGAKGLIVVDFFLWSSLKTQMNKRECCVGNRYIEIQLVVAAIEEQII